MKRASKQVDRKVGAGTVVIGALIAAVLASATVALAGSDGAPALKAANVSKQVKKLAKKVKAANKTAEKALAVAKATSQQTGPAGPPGIVPIQRASDASTVSTTSTTLTNLGGPSVTVTVGAGGGWVVTAAAGEVSSGDAATSCFANVTSTALNPNTGSSFSGNATGVGFIQGTDASFPQGLRYVPPGTHTFRLDYRRDVGSGTCSWKNRKIMVALYE